jgi:hypothetical protein
MDLKYPGYKDRKEPHRCFVLTFPTFLFILRLLKGKVFEAINLKVLNMKKMPEDFIQEEDKFPARSNR